MKPTSKLLLTFALGLSSSSLAAKELKITTQVEPSSTSDKLSLTATFDNFGFEGSSITDSKHPAKGIFDRFKSRLGDFGLVEKGDEAGPNRTSLKVLVDSIDSEAKVASTDSKQPQLAKNILAIHELLAERRQELENLSTQEFADTVKGLPYLELKLPAAPEINRFLLCVTLPYQSTIARNIKVPTFVANQIENLCLADTSVVDLEKLTTLQQKVLLGSANAGSRDISTEEFWNPSSFESTFEICRPSFATQWDELIAAGWLASTTAIENRENECQKFVQKNIVSRLKDSVTLGFKAGVIASRANPYYKGLVESLLAANQVEYKISADAYQSKLADTFRSIFSIQNGVTKNELKQSDFNLEGYMKLIQSGRTDANELLVTLLSAPEGTKSLLRTELAQAPEVDRQEYMKRLLAAVKQPCILGSINPSCIYAGASKIASRTYKLKLQSGLIPTTQFEGFVLESGEQVKP